MMNGLFQVERKNDGKIFTVYGVSQYTNALKKRRDSEFLIYYEADPEEYRWESAELYRPYTPRKLEEIIEAAKQHFGIVSPSEHHSSTPKLEHIYIPNI